MSTGSVDLSKLTPDQVTALEAAGALTIPAHTPADQAGIGPAMKLVAVNSRAWTPEILRATVKAAATNSAPIELLVENDGYFKNYQLDYHAGEKYPCLERDANRADLLDEIIRPLTPEPSTNAWPRTGP